MSGQSLPAEFKAFTIDDNYRWVLLVVLVMILHYFICLASTGGSRRKYFTQPFLEEHFGETHEDATGEKIKKGGYPDHGSGRYASMLDYSGWMEFMKA